MVAVASVLVVIVLTIAMTTVDARYCFDCDTVSVSACADPFIPGSSDMTIVSCSGFCGTITYYSGRVTRGCYSAPTGSANGCEWYSDFVFCRCNDTDLCNVEDGNVCYSCDTAEDSEDTECGKPFNPDSVGRGLCYSGDWCGTQFYDTVDRVVRGCYAAPADNVERCTQYDESVVCKCNDNLCNTRVQFNLRNDAGSPNNWSTGYRSGIIAIALHVVLVGYFAL